ncbi:MAG: hypothetical protein ACYSUI_00055 [Planctomycetota bacterium]
MTRGACIVVTALAAAAVLAGCQTNSGGGGDQSNTLLNVTNRTIPDGQPGLLFTYQAAANEEVTISVQASTDAADPDFLVVAGEVTFEQLDDVPLGDLVVNADNDTSGEEIRSYDGEPAGIYSLFVTDGREFPGATFTILVTQRK